MKRIYLPFIFAVCAVVGSFGNAKSLAQTEFTNTIIIVKQPFAVTRFLSTEFVVTLPKDAVRATTIEINLHRRVASRDSLQTISQGNLALTAIDTVTFPAASLITRGDDVVLPLMLSPGQAETTGLDLKAYGVFPVTIIARDTAGILASSLTFIARVNPADTSQSLATSLVIAHRGPPSLQSDGTILISEQTRSSLRRLLNAMTAFPFPLAIELQPEMLASLASSAAPADQVLLAELTSALTNRSIIAPTYVPIDPSSMADNEQGVVFTQQREQGVGALQKLGPSTPLNNKVWVAHESITRTGASLLGAHGIDSVLLLASAQDSSTKTRSPSAIAHTQLANGSLLSVRRADPAIATLLDRATDNPVQVGIYIAAEVLAARRDLLADTPVADLALVLATTSGESADPITIATIAGALGTTPGITFTDLSANAPPLATTPLVEFSNNASSRLPKLSDINALLTEQNSLQTMLADSDARLSLWNEYSSAIWSTTTKSRNSYISGFSASLRELTSAVGRPTRNKFTLGSTNADIRLQLRNKSSSTLFVKVVLSSPKLKFPTKLPIVELAAESTTEILIPTVVKEKGLSTIILRISTPDGKVQLTTPTLLTARVNVLAGLGQPISLALIAALLLWWAISWRSARRARTSSPATTVKTS